MHELSFESLDCKAKAPGAVRVELFADLIPPDEPIPEYPGANHAGRPWYLRSYTRSPIKLVPPMARVPMRVVYWGRWADSTGNVGPFSATAVAWIEGGSHHHLPGGVRTDLLGDFGARQPVQMLEDATMGPAHREQKFIVAILDAQYQSLNAQEIESEAPALPAPEEREQRRLQAPLESEAA